MQNLQLEIANACTTAREMDNQSPYDVQQRLINSPHFLNALYNVIEQNLIIN